MIRLSLFHVPLPNVARAKLQAYWRSEYAEAVKERRSALGLERYAQVQHLVSTVEGRLRPGVTHFAAFASCFPGGSITGAPKIRAMEIIDELEPAARGPYTGALGYLGFNRQSQLSILIRAAIHRERIAYFQVGAGIVADSAPAAEYDETLAKARGFFEALNFRPEFGYVVLTAES